ncbi:MAG: hypothetical protein AL399_06450 [Candidatus [Bacteroides] periocalifornicus]|uniref:Uncharacterized protein n=1 Tax=Candidatus [Bacteroides] periocalifornicus TaxID=1702214 RepID=A0A0Q4B8K5_9BACT|nr:MAG: hypothetical protein AL399_06450 [Candidatus [Bacteroides] periocalifornicus]
MQPFFYRGKCRKMAGIGGSRREGEDGRRGKNDGRTREKYGWAGVRNGQVTPVYPAHPWASTRYARHRPYQGLKEQ